MNLKRSLAVVGVAFASLAVVFAGTPAMAQPELPAPPVTFDNKTDCANLGSTKGAGTVEAASPTSWKVTVTKPLCKPIKAQVANWKFTNPKQGKWPQTLVETGELVTIQAVGTYTVASPVRDGRICGQSDGYAEWNKAPEVPKTLESWDDKNQPKFLHDFFTAKKPTYTVDDPKECCEAKEPAVDVKVKGCVDDEDGTVTVTVTNPNNNRVQYIVKLGGLELEPKVIEGGKSADFVFEGLSAGEYQLVVIDEKHELKVKKTVELEECPPPTTTSTTTVPPTTTTDTTTVPTTTTTTPGIVPAGNETPTDTGLADTGANVMWLVPMAAVLLLGGGALVLIYRRRGNTQNN